MRRRRQGSDRDPRPSGRRLDASPATSPIDQPRFPGLWQLSDLQRVQSVEELDAWEGELGRR